MTPRTDQDQSDALKESQPTQMPKRMRMERQQPERILTRGDLRIDLAGRVVTHRGQRIELSARLFDLLVYFVRRPGIAISRKHLLEQVCQEEEGDARQVDVYVHWLREKLQDDPAHPEHIQTVRGIGHRFCRE